jgi:hypothetical protein
VLANTSSPHFWPVYASRTRLRSIRRSSASLRCCTAALYAGRSAVSADSRAASSVSASSLRRAATFGACSAIGASCSGAVSAQIALAAPAGFGGRGVNHGGPVAALNDVAHAARSVRMIMTCSPFGRRKRPGLSSVLPGHRQECRTGPWTTCHGLISTASQPRQRLRALSAYRLRDV